MFPLLQNSAGQKIPVILKDSNGEVVTDVTGPTITLSKAVGAYGAIHDGTWAEVGGGLYSIQLDATDTNTVGALVARVVKAGCVDSFVCCSVRATTESAVDVAKVSGTVQTAGDIMGTLQSQGPVATPPTASSSVLTGGVPTGTYANAGTLDGSVWSIPGTAGAAPSVNLVFACGAASKANSLRLWGYYNVGAPAVGKHADVYAYNYVTAAYEMISNSTTRIAGQNGTTINAFGPYPLNTNHISTSGEAQIKVVGNTVGADVALAFDYAPYYYLASGNSLADIARAVWQFNVPSADISNSAAEYLRYIFGDFHGYVNTASDESHVNVTGLPAVADLFNNYRIFFHLEYQDIFIGAYISDMDASGNIVLDTPLPYTPNPGDGVRIYIASTKGTPVSLTPEYDPAKTAAQESTVAKADALAAVNSNVSTVGSAVVTVSGKVDAVASDVDAVAMGISALIEATGSISNAVTLIRVLSQNRLEFDLENSIAYKHSDAGARAYSSTLTDKDGNAVTIDTVGPINMSRWTAL